MGERAEYAMACCAMVAGTVKRMAPLRRSGGVNATGVPFKLDNC